MGVEDRQAFKQQGKLPGERGEKTSDWRSQGGPAENPPAVREQTAHLLRADAARLRVGRVEPEIVPHHPAAWAQHAQQFLGNVLLERRVEQRAEGGVLERQVEAGGGVGQALTVGADERRGGQSAAGFLQAVGEQVEPVQVRGPRAVVEIFDQHAARAAAYFQDLQFLQVGQADLAQQPQGLALALLQGEQGGWIEGRVQVAPCQAAGTIGVFEAQAVEIGQGRGFARAQIFRANADIMRLTDQWIRRLRDH